MCIDLPVGIEEDHEKTWDSLLPVQDSNLGSPESKRSPHSGFRLFLYVLNNGKMQELLGKCCGRYSLLSLERADPDE